MLDVMLMSAAPTTDFTQCELEGYDEYCHCGSRTSFEVVVIIDAFMHVGKFGNDNW